MSNTLNNIKAFPNNFEAEQSLLGCILIDGVVSSKIVSTMDSSSFYNPKHMQIFDACSKLYNNNSNIDIITVNDQLERDQKSDANTMSYLVELSSIIPSAANYNEYYKILDRDRLLRKLITNCNMIIEEAYNSQDSRKSLGYAESLIYEISASMRKTDLTHISVASKDLLSRIDEMTRNKASFRGLNTGYPIFDKVTNGLQKGDLIIIAARPSVGKTSLALNYIGNIASMPANKDTVMAIFSLEMPAMHLVQRLVANCADISMNNLSKGSVPEDQQANLWRINSTLSNSKVYIDDSSLITPADILSKCRRLSSQEKKIDLIVVDYLQLMTTGRKSAGDNRQQEISEMSRMMKILAKEMSCPVIVISQMSRGIESRDDKTPKLADLRESGAIEQDADIVMFITREDENDKQKGEYDVILDIAKHRNGELAAIRYHWVGENIRFYESDNQHIDRSIQTAPKRRDNAQN